MYEISPLHLLHLSVAELIQVLWTGGLADHLTTTGRVKARRCHGNTVTKADQTETGQGPGEVMIRCPRRESYPLVTTARSVN